MAKLQPLEQEHGIDPVSLRALYRAERDRRLRPEGLGQFVRSDRDHHRRFVEDSALRPTARKPPISASTGLTDPHSVYDEALCAREALIAAQEGKPG